MSNEDFTPIADILSDVAIRARVHLVYVSDVNRPIIYLILSFNMMVMAVVSFISIPFRAIRRRKFEREIEEMERQERGEEKP